MSCHWFWRPAFRRGVCSILFAGLLVTALGCAEDSAEEIETVVLDPAEAAQRADSIRQEVAVQLADGLDLTLWAADPLLADPVALAIDDHGRAYVTRTNRQKNSEFEIRSHQDWMTRSISLQSVEDRRAFLHEEFAPERSAENEWLPDLNGDGSHDWRDLTVEQERVYRVEDASGDGVADRAQVVVEAFNTEVTDVAGGVLPFGDDLYVAVAPDLWRLRDTSGDGVADTQESISHGYQAHIGFGGHGMSGLTYGPDGRIYWSIGDIGLNVVAPDGTRWAYPNQGAVLRSEPDGSGFEVFAAGVRNTHEFVFDEYGNMISVDNDGDHAGETERLVYLVNGSDSGWRTNWQFGKYTDPKNNDYKVWMDEEMFKPRFEGQAAYITPPVASYHSGPAGMAYNPGTALSEKWRNTFFVAEFTGSPARSRIFGFRLEPQGAGFAFAGEEVLTQGILATGLDFGPDGALYFADWIDGWGTKDAGRIWKLDTPEAAGSALRQETQELLGADFTERAEAGLLELLQHDDMRVRLKAQFELARRGDAETLLTAAEQTDHQLARLHGLWGIGQLARQDLAAAELLTTFLQDADPEIRAQAAKVIGDVRYADAGEALVPLLQDDAPRARFFAAEALGRIAYRPAVQPIIDMLEANDDEDVYLRHAGSLALARVGEAEPVVALADDSSRALRIAAVVALRRMQHSGVARFLEDDDEYIVTEAARAINDDFSIEAALPDLARVLEREGFTDEALLRRAINANLRMGMNEYAERVAAFAARASAPEAMRVEALATLATWADPSVLDRVDGRYRGRVARDPAGARDAMGPVIEPLLTGSSVPVQVAAAEAVGRLQFEPALPTLLTLLRQDGNPEVRLAALAALHVAEYADMEEAVQVALDDAAPTVRMTALELIPSLGLPEARTAEMLASVLGSGSVEEQQSALQALGTMQRASANEVLAGMVDELAAGDLPPEIELDVMEAVEASGSDSLEARLAEYRDARPADDPVAAFHEALYGGSAERGAQVFFQNPAAQCIRCHAVGGRGGDVGPSLTGIAGELSREQLLEALVDPSARIAPGFGTVMLTLQDGRTVSGIVREETDEALVIQMADGTTQQVAPSEVTDRQDGTSSMPPMGALLSRRDLRDVVAFMSSLE